jgi:peptidoglycan hydrolase-like protein with peptidoglycan-binding domain
VGGVAAAVTAAVVLSAAPASASGDYSGLSTVAGSDGFTDDWNDEGILSTTRHASSNATCLWQKILWADGKLAWDDIDGVFGPGTREATKKWQQEWVNGTADGIVGKATFTAAGKSLRTRTATAPSTPTAAPRAVPSWSPGPLTATTPSTTGPARSESPATTTSPASEQTRALPGVATRGRRTSPPPQRRRVPHPNRPVASLATSMAIAMTMSGCTRYTSRVRCVPHPALNVHPCQACAAVVGVSNCVRARPAACAHAPHLLLPDRSAGGQCPAAPFLKHVAGADPDAGRAWLAAPDRRDPAAAGDPAAAEAAMAVALAHEEQLREQMTEEAAARLPGSEVAVLLRELAVTAYPAGRGNPAPRDVAMIRAVLAGLLARDVALLPAASRSLVFGGDLIRVHAGDSAAYGGPRLSRTLLDLAAADADAGVQWGCARAPSAGWPASKPGSTTA